MQQITGRIKLPQALNRFVFLLLAICITQTAFSQLKKAREYFHNGQYADAIPYYELFRKEKRNRVQNDVMREMATCYRLTNDYNKAEAIYTALITQGADNDMDHFYYAEVLRKNAKPQEAKEQYKLYAKSVPQDKTIELKVKSLEELKILLGKSPECLLKKTKHLNSKSSEYAPVYYKNGIVFVSDKNQDLVNFETSAQDQLPYIDIYFCDIKEQNDSVLSFGKLKPFSSAINTVYHDGPACFSADGNTIYFNRVSDLQSKKKDFVNRAKLYTSTFVNNKWTKSEELPFNSDDYSVMHPSLSADGQTLFFDSDKPGGFGGADIYSSKKEGNSWGAPVNLGSEINTPLNDVFPCIRKDGLLFFSSEAHAGYGGLDIYSAEFFDNKWGSVTNLGANINSTFEDYGITFDEEGKKGFFSSDRSGGLGREDIYAFTVTEKFVALAGKILLTKNTDDFAKGLKINLLREDGTVVKITNTDEEGRFKFANLPPDQKYMVKVDESDPAFAEQKKFYMADESSRVVGMAVVDEKENRIIFRGLPPDISTLPTLNDSDVTIAGNLTAGDDGSQILANTKVSLVNEKGEVIQTVTTNDLGAFVFTALPKDQNYMIKVDESDTKLAGNKVNITNKAGDVIATSTADAPAEIKLAFLSADKNVLSMMQIEDTELHYELKGKLLASDKKPLANMKVFLYNGKGEIVQTLYTDEKGRFIFKGLKPDPSYMISVDEKDPSIAAMDSLFIADEKDNIIRKLKYDKEGKIRFRLLAEDKKKMEIVYADDPWIKQLEKSFNKQPDNVIAGNLMVGADGAQPVANAKVYMINEKGEVLQTATTNALGAFVFTDLPKDQNFFIKVDEEDTRLSDNKVTVTNKTGDVIATKEAGKKEEIKIVFLTADKNSLTLMKVEDTDLRYDMRGKLLSGNKAPLASTRIFLYNGKGEIIQTVFTDDQGRFIFINLPLDPSYMIAVDETDPKLKNEERVYITDDKNNIIKELKFDKEGKIRFRLLPEYKTGMEKSFADDPVLKAFKPTTAPPVAKAEVHFDMQGFLLSIEKKPFHNIRILLYNGKGELVQTVFTDASGKFIFYNLPLDPSYLVSVDDSDPKLAKVEKLYITDAKGNVIRELTYDRQGKLSFRLLPEYKEGMGQAYTVDPALRTFIRPTPPVVLVKADENFDMQGYLTNADKKPLANTHVFLYNGKGEIVQSVFTDASGKFTFANLPVDPSYMITIDENDPKITSLKKLFVMDTKGNIIRELKYDKEGKIRFRLLPDYKVGMAATYTSDPSLKNFIKPVSLAVAKKDDKAVKTNTTVVASANNNPKNSTVNTATAVAVNEPLPEFPPILFDFAKTQVKEDADKELNDIYTYMKDHKDVKLEIYGHTDSKGGDNFNMQLSYRRASIVKNYFTGRGMIGTRIKVIARGETMPRAANENPDQSDNPDGRELNRRTEFKLVAKKR